MSANQVGDELEPLVRIPSGIGEPGTLDPFFKRKLLQSICEFSLAQKDKRVEVRET